MRGIFTAGEAFSSDNVVNNGQQKIEDHGDEHCHQMLSYPGFLFLFLVFLPWGVIVGCAIVIGIEIFCQHKGRRYNADRQ